MSVSSNNQLQLRKMTHNRVSGDVERADEHVTDPAAITEHTGIPAEHETYHHDDVDHCEHEAAGRAIVGVINNEGRLLCVVHPEEGHVVLPNETVPAGGDWAAVARERAAGMADVEVTLDGVQLVRTVDHAVAGTVESRTHHVLFTASLADPDAPLEGLCNDNPWELRWLSAVPGRAGDDPQGPYVDIKRLLEAV